MTKDSLIKETIEELFEFSKLKDNIILHGVHIPESLDCGRDERIVRYIERAENNDSLRVSLEALCRLHELYFDVVRALADSNDEKALILYTEREHTARALYESAALLYELL